MAGRRVYGGSNPGVLIQDDRMGPQAFEKLVASGSSTTRFHGSRSMVSFEDYRGITSNGPFYNALDLKEIDDDEFDECLQPLGKKRRLASNQVLSLEKTFELENKLEPEKKIQLARDLGLHPRQVAIWFQNRRARWKTKQLEKDYEVLKSSHDLLKADYESLLKEKEKLKTEPLSTVFRRYLPEEEVPMLPRRSERLRMKRRSRLTDDLIPQKDESSRDVPHTGNKKEAPYYSETQGRYLSGRRRRNQGRPLGGYETPEEDGPV